MGIGRHTELTKAEEILTKYIKGDIRDYDDRQKKYHSITLDLALEIIDAILNEEKTIYVLLEDSDQTTFSRPEPIRFATTNEAEAKKFFDVDRYGRRYMKVTVVDELPENIYDTGK